MRKLINYEIETGQNGKKYIYCKNCGVGLLLHGGFSAPGVDVKKESCYCCGEPYLK
jgi:hypothetical protein